MQYGDDADVLADQEHNCGSALVLLSGELLLLEAPGTGQGRSSSLARVQVHCICRRTGRLAPHVQSSQGLGYRFFGHRVA